ncbi:MAG: TetR/AcrR family transcriptional regulator [Eubacteriales bacterium]|nr:TetR/AcrR family transcriptional regulator [Eubacteriales bacterium]
MPKAKITKEMIVDAAFEVARTEGAENINARTVSERLHCSTQPVLYHFHTIEEIRNEAFRKADRFHTAYIMNVQGCYDNPMLEIAMRYIKFAETEKHLFRFLFQSNKFVNRNLSDWVDDEKIIPIIRLIGEQGKIDGQQAKNLFTGIYMMMHGYASMFANNSMEFDEASIIRNLQTAFLGMIGAMKEKQEK